MFLGAYSFDQMSDDEDMEPQNRQGTSVSITLLHRLYLISDKQAELFCKHFNIIRKIWGWWYCPINHCNIPMSMCIILIEIEAAPTQDSVL